MYSFKRVGLSNKCVIIVPTKHIVFYDMFFIKDKENEDPTKQIKKNGKTFLYVYHRIKIQLSLLLDKYV